MKTWCFGAVIRIQRERVNKTAPCASIFSLKYLHQNRGLTCFVKTKLGHHQGSSWGSAESRPLPGNFAAANHHPSDPSDPLRPKLEPKKNRMLRRGPHQNGHTWGIPCMEAENIWTFRSFQIWFMMVYGQPSQARPSTVTPDLPQLWHQTPPNFPQLRHQISLNCDTTI